MIRTKVAAWPIPVSPPKGNVEQPPPSGLPPGSFTEATVEVWVSFSSGEESLAVNLKEYVFPGVRLDKLHFLEVCHPLLRVLSEVHSKK